MLIPPSPPANVAIGAFLLGTPARAAVEAGQLACNVGGSPGFIIGSSRPLSCTFSGPAGLEHCVGSVTLGVDIGYVDGGQITWGVVAATAYPGAGFARRQLYLGNRQRGGWSRGWHRRIDRRLQPVSVVAQSGLDVSAGLATINLQYAP